MRLRVLMLARYGRQGASSRLRMWDLVPGLADRGVDVTPHGFFDDAYVNAHNAGERVLRTGIAKAYVRRLAALVRPRTHDVLWIEKEALPAIPGGLETTLLRGIPYVLDVSDTLFLKYQEHRRAIVRAMLGRKMVGLARRAQLTVVGNTALESWAREGGAARILCLPTGVDVERYRPRKDPRHGPLVIGWIGSPETASYLGPFGEVLGKLARETGAVIRLVGAGSFRLPGVSIDALPWSEDTESDLVAGFDVGIVPLPDTPWCRGKSPYKLFQYMAAGVPVVGSAVGVNTTVIEHGVNGLLARTPAEWRTAIMTLAVDPALRARLGGAGRRLIEECYSRDAIVRRMADALASAAIRKG